MKIIIVDTNIIFSCILNPRSKIGELLLNSSDCIEYYAPAFLRLEIEKHKEKIKEISGLTDMDIEELKAIIFSQIHFINEEQIPFRVWQDSARLLREIDSDDVAFLAASKHMNEDLWTGDKRLSKGLISKGYPKVLSTSQVLEIRRELRDRNAPNKR